MSRVYVPWTPRPTPHYRGPARLLAGMAVLMYRVFGPVVRTLPGPILLGATVGAGVLAWAVGLLYYDVNQALEALHHGAAKPAGWALPLGMTIESAWSVRQLEDVGRSLGLWMPGRAMWVFQFLLVRDVVGLLGIITFVSLVAVIGIWGERKVAGHMQSRPGPMRVGGWHGWSQSVADGIKLLSKEDLIPRSADGVLFRLAPYLAFVPALAGFIALPFSAYWVFRDLDVSLLFLLAVLGIEVLSVILAGWASNNKWSLFGGMREACQVVSYEIPMGMSLLIPVMVCESLRFNDMAARQDAGWFSWLAFHSPWTFIAMFTYFISSLASCKRAPFDLPEGESELVSGFHTEYSGFRWSLFFFAEYAAMFIVSGILVIAFLGAWHAPWPAPDWLRENQGLGYQFLHGLAFSGPIWFIIKCALLVWLQMWLRWTLPRIRIDQVLYSCIQVMLPLVMVCLLASTFWELWLGSAGEAFSLLAYIVSRILGIIGLIALFATLYVIAHGFSNRRTLVGTMAVDLLPGA